MSRCASRAICGLLPPVLPDVAQLHIYGRGLYAEPMPAAPPATRRITRLGLRVLSGTAWSASSLDPERENIRLRLDQPAYMLPEYARGHGWAIQLLGYAFWFYGESRPHGRAPARVGKQCPAITFYRRSGFVQIGRDPACARICCSWAGSSTGR